MPTILQVAGIHPDAQTRLERDYTVLRLDLPALDAAGAALDVFADEPNVPAALLAMGTVIATPHIASGTHETRRAMGELMLDNLDAYFAGRPLPTAVA